MVTDGRSTKVLAGKHGLVLLVDHISYKSIVVVVYFSGGKLRTAFRYSLIMP
jgi:hypothetical protein